jgi:hypothetical protein
MEEGREFSGEACTGYRWLSRLSPGAVLDQWALLETYIPSLFTKLFYAVHDPGDLTWCPPRLLQ